MLCGMLAVFAYAALATDTDFGVFMYCLDFLCILTTRVFGGFLKAHNSRISQSWPKREHTMTPHTSQKKIRCLSNCGNDPKMIWNNWDGEFQNRMYSFCWECFCNTCKICHAFKSLADTFSVLLFSQAIQPCSLTFFLSTLYYPPWNWRLALENRPDPFSGAIR